MNLMTWFQSPKKQKITCRVPKSESPKNQKYWDKACEQNPAKSGCKIYED